VTRIAVFGHSLALLSEAGTTSPTCGHGALLGGPANSVAPAQRHKTSAITAPQCGPAFINAVTLVAIASIFFMKAGMRLYHPVEVHPK